MTRLRILSLPQVDRLRQEATSNLSPFQVTGPFPLPEESTLLPTLIEAPNPPSLVVDPTRHTADDAANAIRVFQWLSDLDMTQAADPRLWTTLGLREFWGYMQKRWPVASTSTTESRYFVTGGRKALNRHGIARLWWGAALTYAPWDRQEDLSIFRSEDPARFTKVLFSQQQYAVDLMERNLGGSLLLRISVLASLEEFGPTVRKRDDLSQQIGKDLNQLLQTQQLETRPAQEVRDIVRNLVRRVAKDLASEHAVT